MTDNNSHGKLAYFGSVIPSYSATFVYREIFELDRRGIPLLIYSLHTPVRKGLSADALPLCDRGYHLLPARIPEFLQAHVHYVLRSPLRYLRAAFRMLTARHKDLRQRMGTVMHFGGGVVLARRMERDGVTHIHAHYSSHPSSVALAIHFLTGINFSFSAHAYDIWAARLLHPEKLRAARFAVCCSGLGRRELISQGAPQDAAKVHVVYHGIDVRRFVPPENPGKRDRLILGLGRLEDVKGFHHLVEACAILKSKGVPFHCRIVGDGDERERLKALIQRLGVEKEVEMFGAVRQEDILPHYHEAAIFAMPCVGSEDGRHDGIPNVFVEAMATALPVVSTNFSAIPELIDDGVDGFLVRPGCPEELADCLERLLGDRALRESAGAKGRAKTVERFDNRKTIEPLIELLTRECGMAGGPRGNE